MSLINHELSEGTGTSQTGRFGVIVRLDGSDGGGGTATRGKKMAPARIRRRRAVQIRDKPWSVRFDSQDGRSWPGQVTLGNQVDDAFVIGMVGVVMNRRVGSRVSRQKGDDQ